MNPLPAIFDAHFHIIDPRFPLVPNDGYLPEPFTCQDYRKRMAGYTLRGGAVVSGSFQGFDQTYLTQALATLGPTFVGVTQLPADVSEQQLQTLHEAGVRALRFNLRRGGSQNVRHLARMARRAHEIVGWPVELYIDSGGLADLYDTLTALPAISIDHLGLSTSGWSYLRRLVERGARVKASGFGRVDFDVASALQDLYAANPQSLMFGTDLPSTRAPRAYRDDDVALVQRALGEPAVADVLYNNALAFYNPAQAG